MDKLETEDVLCCLLRPSQEEPALIQCIYLEGKTERQGLQETNVPQQIIHSRKKAVRKKIGRMLEQNGEKSPSK